MYKIMTLRVPEESRNFLTGSVTTTCMKLGVVDDCEHAYKFCSTNGFCILTGLLFLLSLLLKDAASTGLHCVEIGL
jgi:hypothetical protein